MRVVSLILLSLCLALPALAEGAKWERLFVEEATASSYLKNNWNKYSENYHPNYAFDDDPKTAWVEGADGDGHGSWIRFEVSRVPKAKALKLRFRNGYQKSKKLFTANAVPKVFQIIVRGGGQELTQTATLQKARGWQEVVVPLKGAGLREVELRLQETYPGRVYKDTCLSDVQVFVDSEVPYAAKVEQGKRDRLKAWVKGRLKEARYFASLPRSYPFASTHFERVKGWSFDQASNTFDGEKAKPDPGYAPLKEIVQAPDRVSHAQARDKLKALAKPLAEVRALAAGKKTLSKTRFRVEGGGKMVLPDGVSRWELPEMLHPFLEGGRASLAETPKEVRSHLSAKGEPIDGYILDRKRSTAQAERVDGKVRRLYFWERLEGVERGTFVNHEHFLVDLDEGGRMTRAVQLTDGSETWNLSAYEIERDEAGKITAVELTRFGSWEDAGYNGPVVTNTFSNERLVSGAKVSQR